MQKTRAFLSVALTASLIVLAAGACDSDPSSSFNDGEDDSGAGDTGPGFNTDGDTTGRDATGPVDCKPSLPASFTPAWKPPTKANVCGTDQISAYFQACIANLGLDAGDACKTWMDANTACGTCIETADNSGPIQWHRDRYYYTLNIAGCLAIERNELAEGQCPATYAASIQCQRDSCDGCFQSGDATFEDFQRCQQSAKQSACAGFEGKVGQICGTTYNDPDGGAFRCFRNNDNAGTHILRLAGIFCGP
ncbi:MAG: hypothetical protein KF764_03915 [Labilithrix sp.]|nr:hypothetical protein [Labilithrix sp.]MBX3222192.1 hypothetical protein [Labilithrix sp.]